MGMNFGRLGEWLSAFVWVVFNACAFVYSARHHAGPGEEGVVDGIGGYVCISVLEVDVDHD